MIILIAGGTGTAGRVLAARAVAAGHRVRVLTRRPDGRPDSPVVQFVSGDLVDGRGLAEAVAGTDVVVDLSNTPATRRAPAAAFFTTGTRRLLDAEAAAGVGRHVTVSIVGVDRFPSPYYRAKRAQELTALGTAERLGVGCSIVRVTQFHDFAATVAERFRLGRLVLAPALRVRPVHLHDVADHLLEVAGAAPAGTVDEFGGPRDEELPDLVRRYVAAVRAPLAVHTLPLFGSQRRANQDAVLRPRTGAQGRLNFDEWLEEVSCSARPCLV